MNTIHYTKDMVIMSSIHNMYYVLLMRSSIKKLISQYEIM